MHVAGYSAFAAVALLTGFAMMTIQTVLIRLGGLSLGSSQFTFSMVVAVFVLCIALGSFAVSALSRIPNTLLPIALWVLLLLLGVLYEFADSAPYWAHALRNLYRDQSVSFYPFQIQAFLGMLLCLGLPVALSGAVLPLMFHALRETVTDLGDVAGRLYSWNTTGSLLGALIGGYALLFWLDLHHIYRIAMAAIAIAALLTTLRSFDVGTDRARDSVRLGARRDRDAAGLGARAALGRALPQSHRPAGHLQRAGGPLPHLSPGQARLLRRRSGRVDRGQGVQGQRTRRPTSRSSRTASPTARFPATT